MPEEPPPINGWQTPGSEEPAAEDDAFAQLARALLEVVPPDLRARLADALRELLRALRALIEWWIERLERRGAGGGPPEVRDIPVL